MRTLKLANNMGCYLADIKGCNVADTYFCRDGKLPTITFSGIECHQNFFFSFFPVGK